MDKIIFAKIPVLLISGKAGVGKTTFANFIKKYAEENKIKANIIPFASGVKEVARLAGWDGVKDSKGRRFLQEIGNSGRNYDKDIWVKKAYNNVIIDGSSFIILHDDWRFPNESEYIFSQLFYSVHPIRIEAPSRELLKGTPEYNDESEISLPSGPNHLIYEYCIENEKLSLKELEETAIYLLLNILEKEEKF